MKRRLSEEQLIGFLKHFDAGVAVWRSRTCADSTPAFVFPGEAQRNVAQAVQRFLGEAALAANQQSPSRAVCGPTFDSLVSSASVSREGLKSRSCGSSV